MSDDTVVTFKPLRMSETDYLRERERIRETYGENRTEAGNLAEQALAKLFIDSGWSQDELAIREGKTQQWVAYRIRFGRFLVYAAKTTTVVSLSERAFRHYWDQTDGSDLRRFQQVLAALEGDRTAPVKNRNALMDQIRDLYSNGKWHNTDAIANRIGRERDEVERTLAGAASRGHRRYRIERRRRGRDFQYCIYPMEKVVSTVELTEKLAPLITQLKAEGRKNMATIAIAKIADIAAEMQMMLDEWTR